MPKQEWDRVRKEEGGTDAVQTTMVSTTQVMFSRGGDQKCISVSNRC